MAILTIPPTLDAPKNKELLFQTTGSLNKTYSWSGSKIVYVLPINNGIGRLAIVYSQQLLDPRQTKSERSPGRMLQNDVTTRMFLINEIEVGSPALQFDKFDDNKLLALGNVSLDIYYNEFPNYKKV